jgi:hypothetical protein
VFASVVEQVSRCGDCNVVLATATSATTPAADTVTLNVTATNIFASSTTASLPLNVHLSSGM